MQIKHQPSQGETGPFLYPLSLLPRPPSASHPLPAASVEDTTSLVLLWGGAGRWGAGPKGDFCKANCIFPEAYGIPSGLLWPSRGIDLWLATCLLILLSLPPASEKLGISLWTFNPTPKYLGLIPFRSTVLQSRRVPWKVNHSSLCKFSLLFSLPKRKVLYPSPPSLRQPLPQADSQSGFNIASSVIICLLQIKRLKHGSYSPWVPTWPQWLELCPTILVLVASSLKSHSISALAQGADIVCIAYIPGQLNYPIQPSELPHRFVGVCSGERGRDGDFHGSHMMLPTHTPNSKPLFSGD